MDEAYADLVRYQVELEENNSALGEAQQFIVSVLASLTAVLILAPTTWNFSPRDANGVPGALEQALGNAPVRAGETTPVAAQHIVHFFDPCMVCTVH